MVTLPTIRLSLPSNPPTHRNHTLQNPSSCRTNRRTWIHCHPPQRLVGTPFHRRRCSPSFWVFPSTRLHLLVVEEEVCCYPRRSKFPDRLKHQGRSTKAQEARKRRRDASVTWLKVAAVLHVCRVTKWLCVIGTHWEVLLEYWGSKNTHALCRCGSPIPSSDIKWCSRQLRRLKPISWYLGVDEPTRNWLP